MVAAIAQPSDVRLPVIDHERELDALGAALSDAARFGDTELRVTRSGTAEAIRQSLTVPCQILHLACHGRPGKLVLEAPGCASQPVGPAMLTDQILGGLDGRPRVPFIALMGCSTAVSGTADHSAANDPTNHETVANLALALMNAGAHGVLATSAVVGDRYLNLFTRHWYAALLGGKTADPASACAAARREVEHHRRELPDKDPDATRLRDWSAPVLFLREGATSLPGWPAKGSAPGKFTVTGRRQPRPLPSGPAPVRSGTVSGKKCASSARPGGLMRPTLWPRSSPPRYTGTATGTPSGMSRPTRSKKPRPRHGKPTGHAARRPAPATRRTCPCRTHAGPLPVAGPPRRRQE